MTGRNTEISPRLVARMAGLFFLLTILGGVFAQGFVSNRLITYSDPAATATNILAHRGLFQLSLSVFLIEMACQVASTALFYVLLRPVSKTLALLSAFWGLTGSIIKTSARVFYGAPLFVLAGSSVLSGFSAEQLQQLAVVLLRINGLGTSIALPFFGLSTVVEGYLVFRSRFLPRWLGVLSIIGGAGWLTYFYAPLGYRAWPVVVFLALLSSAVKIFWLLVFSVNEQRWIEQASKT